MPSIRYMNQSAPFWDFIASLEQQGAEHPMFAGRNRNEQESSDEEAGWAGPWGLGGFGWPGANRGWHRGPPGPPPYPGAHPPPPHHDGPEPAQPPEKDGPSGPPGEPADPPESVPPPQDGPEHDRRGHHGRHGRHHGPHGPHGDREHFRRGGRCGGRGGSRGPWGRRGMGPFNMSALSDFIQSQMFEGGAGNDNEREQQQQDFKPAADVFDTEAAFVVHVSLPGAKKEDVAVNWDAEKSELSIAGVVHRPGDEEFLKTLALDERKIGAFERKIRLGSRANPALVDVDGITAKFEDGVLVVTVPKEDKDFVEVKKVDIE